MYVANAEQMRNIDRRATEEYGIPGVVLMENAALQVVAVLERRYPALSRQRVAIVAGRGNNGGDGFAVARHLLNRGVAVHLYVLADPERIGGDAKINLDAAIAAGVPRTILSEAAQLDALARDLQHADLIIDALLGTGISSAVREFFALAIQHINAAPAPVIAVDLPSGLQTDSGRILGEHVHADLTVTFALPKLGVVLYPSAEAIGELIVADISIPRAAIEAEGISIELLEEAEMRATIPRRSAEAHKGDYGHLLVVAGSRGMGGAAMLSSLAGLRSGSGLVTLAWPAGLQASRGPGLMEIMTLPLLQNEMGRLHPGAAAQVLRFVHERHPTAVVIGPGLTVHADTTALCRALLEEIHCPCVLDADALNALSSAPEVIRGAAAPLVLTPHPGEMGRLLGCSTQEVQDDRLAAAQKAVQQFQQTIILKGARSIIAAPDGTLAINPTGNPGMATGGMGDVLAGLLGALLAQGLNPVRAAKAATFLHGKAGDAAAARQGQTALIARDVLEALPQVFQAFEA